MALIRGVVFDLDDTLYLERDYVRSGLQAISTHLAAARGTGDATPPPAPELFDFLWRQFEAGRRGNLFDALLAAHPSLAGRFPIADLVRIYREHRPQLILPQETADAVGMLHGAGVRLGLISDGVLDAQLAKWNALGLAPAFTPVFFTDVWGRRCWKPHPRAFGAVSRAWQLPPAALVYVGDNPHKDFVAPRRLGWKTVRLRRPGQLWYEEDPGDGDHAPDVEVPSLSDLPRVLSQLCPGEVSL